MEPKPAHLNPSYGAQFGDAALVAAYKHRPRYADAALEALCGLLVPGGRGCSTSAAGEATSRFRSLRAA